MNQRVQELHLVGRQHEPHVGAALLTIGGVRLAAVGVGDRPDDRDPSPRHRLPAPRRGARSAQRRLEELRGTPGPRR